MYLEIVYLFLISYSYFCIQNMQSTKKTAWIVSQNWPKRPTPITTHILLKPGIYGNQKPLPWLQYAGKSLDITASLAVKCLSCNIFAPAGRDKPSCRVRLVLSPWPWECHSCSICVCGKNFIFTKFSLYLSVKLPNSLQNYIWIL